MFRPSGPGAHAVAVLLSFFALPVASPRADASMLLLGGVPSVVAEVNSPYSFAPRVIASDNSVHHFEIDNLPRWASFDPVWGRITGVPGAADIGWHGAITIRMQVGGTTLTLPQFSIWVQPAGSSIDPVTTYAQVMWTPPTLNEDGSPAADLAGYVVYLGRSPQSLQPFYQTNDPRATSATVRSLPTGRLYLAVAAYTHAGVQSDLSELGSVLVN